MVFVDMKNPFILQYYFIQLLYFRHSESRCMHISNLKLYQFNNYETCSVEWVPTINVVVGDNGMGKTNLVDAIYFLCLTKSYFSSLDKYSVMEGTDQFRLEGRFEKEGYPDIVEIKVREGKPKEVNVSGKKLVKHSEHIGKLPCVIIAPDDIHNLLSGSAERRSFLNNILVQTDPRYLENLLIYNKCLKQRNALLKQFHEKHYFDGLLLEGVTKNMYSASAYIYERRKETLVALRPLLTRHYEAISGGQEHCDIQYRSQLHDGDFKELLNDSLEKDKLLCRTTVGVHKDDLVFTLKDHGLKNFASQGQLKSYIIALKLAQYDYIAKAYGARPILILDDLYDKLDAKRVQALLGVVSKGGGQIFITDTGKERIGSLLQNLDLTYKQVGVVKGKLTE